MTTILIKKWRWLNMSLLKITELTWDHSKILTFETDFNKRRFLKSFFSHNSENVINDKENCFYSKTYDNFA